MQTEFKSEAVVLRDHKRLSSSFYHKIGLTFLGLTLLVGIVYTGTLYYAAPILQAEQEKANSEALINNLIANAPPFTFQIVPDALTALKMPDQENSAESKVALNEEFTSARSHFLDPGDSEVPNIYDMPVGEMTYLEYMNELSPEIQYPFLQMLSEIEMLVVERNKEYLQTTVASRTGNDQALVFGEASLNTRGEVSVYPSLRVAQAHFAAEVLARQFPSEAGFYREYADSFIQSGLAYGHYSKHDASRTQALVDDYLNAAAKNESGLLVLQSFEQ
jgi:hypothetical protein